MVAGLETGRVDAQAVALVGGDEVDLLDVEAELVEAVHALVEQVPLAGRERDLAGQLVPEAFVAFAHLRRDGERVAALVRAERLLEVEQLAEDVLLGDLEVVLPLALRERRLPLARLGVDEVGGERAGVAAHEHVRERAVAPVEARQVQPDEEVGDALRDAAERAGDELARDHEAAREREVEVARDQHVPGARRARGRSRRAPPPGSPRARGPGGSGTRAARGAPAAP